MTNTQKTGTQQLYADALVLHLVHTGRFVPWDCLDK